MALKAMREASARDQVREMIEFRRKAEHDEATRLEQARIEGREEGRQEGRQETLQEVARRLRASGVGRAQLFENRGCIGRAVGTQKRSHSPLAPIPSS